MTSISLPVGQFALYLAHGTHAAAALASLLAAAATQNLIEHRLRIPPPPVDAAFPRPGLFPFRRARYLLLLAAAAEAPFWGAQWLPLTIMGVCMYVVGIVLRLIAIRTLGPMWSFHVVRYVGHRLVRNGIYSVLDHPAYLGNVYLVGMTLAVGSPLTALISTLYVSWFYISSARRECRILSPLRR